MRNHNKKQESLQIIGDNIRQYRIQKGMTLERLAYHAKIDEKNLGRIERGKQEPYFITLYKIARVLDVTIDDLSDGLEYIIKLESRH